VLDLMEDEEELWSEFGLRSLSKSDELYHTGEDYWRGPVWMPINYLAVSQLLVSFPPMSHFPPPGQY
jgi:mannosyl-oligosaccharide glucosidase